MYQPNLLFRNVLITPQEVIAKTPGSNTIDPGKYQHAIEVAEERFVAPALGHDFYEMLIDAKNKLVNDGNKVSLQNSINAAYPNSQAWNLSVNDIVNASEFLNQDMQTLWNRHLWKFVAECVHFVAIPENFADFTSQGIMQNNPAIPSLGTNSNNTATIDLRSAKFLMDKWLQDRIEPLKEAMHAWICRYKNNYPLYSMPCSCGEDGISTTGKGGWITSIYDDEDGGRRC